MQRGGDDERGGWELNGENIQRSRVRIDTRKWMLSKMLPKTFGDKTEVVVAGPNGGPAQVERVIVPTNSWTTGNEPGPDLDAVLHALLADPRASVELS